MPTTKKQNKVRNHLWIARKRAGLGQKQVSYLMDHKTPDQVSRYEKGSRIPGLKIIIQLEIIYRTPLKFLYPELYEQTGLDVRQRALHRKGLTEKCSLLLQEDESLGEFCAYLELLEKPSLSEPEKNHLKKHVIKIMRHIANL